jgi:thioredoxin-dependent peroxiredoxin
MNPTWGWLAAMGVMLGVAAGAVPAVRGLEVGDRAPEFTLQGTDGKTYSLEQFRGERPVVIAWFPKAFTAG